MLKNEWEQLLGQLQAARGANTKFFAFVDTISARNFAGTNDSHGWVGLRFLQQPGGTPSDIFLHVNLMDQSNVQQQEAVGILGVNLIYAVYYAPGSAEQFLQSVFEELGLLRLEIDYLEWSGPAFASWNREEVHTFLVAGGYAEAVAFQADGQLAPPNDLLYKRALVLAPGRFDSVSDLHANLIEDTLAQLPEEELKESKGGLGLFCVSVAGLTPPGQQPTVKEILERIRGLQQVGYGVMLFRAQELYTMSAFANRYTKLRIHFAIGLTVHLRVLQDRYHYLPGTQLEGLARLFTQNVRVTVYPVPAEELRKRASAGQIGEWSWKETNGMVHADDLRASGPLDSLHRYLLDSKLVLPGKPR
jgi:hypothetical protein